MNLATVFITAALIVGSGMAAQRALAFEYGHCVNSQLPCLLVPDRDPTLVRSLEEARAYLKRVRVWPEAGDSLWVVSGQQLPTLFALEAESYLGHTFRERSALLFGADNPQTWRDPDAVTHELTHFVLRMLQGSGERSVLVGERANTEPGLLQEAIADFVAASRSGRPTIARGVTPDALEARSLLVAVHCPDDLTGDPHSDSVIVSSALWRLRDANSSDDVVRAVLSAARETRDIAAFARTLESRLPQRMATRWRELVDELGLERCRSPIALQPGERRSARSRAFHAPGRNNYPGHDAQVLAPQRFEVDFGDAGATGMTASLRAQSDLVLLWSSGTVHGRAALSGKARPSAVIDFGCNLRRVELSIASELPYDATYDDLEIRARR